MGHSPITTNLKPASCLKASAMEEIDCDVLVVGCGPAGSSTAKAAATEGARTIAIDRKQEIGTPVRCGEAVGESLLGLIDFEIPEKTIAWNIEGALFFTDGWRIANTSQYWRGRVLERKLFDKWLACEASRAGARVSAKTNLVDFSKDEKGFTAVVEGTKNAEIRAEILVAADGTDSTILRKIGEYAERLPAKELGIVAEYEASNVRLENPSFFQFFMTELAENGYAYVFPKGRDVCNVGVALRNSRRNPQESLNEFIAEHPLVRHQFKEAGIVEVKGGGVSVAGPSEKPYSGNILIVGNAAAQNLAHVAEGIIPSMICGGIAGRAAAEAGMKGVSAGKLYANELKKHALWREFQAALAIKKNIDFVLRADLDAGKKRLLSLLLFSEAISPVGEGVFSKTEGEIAESANRENRFIEVRRA